MKHVIYPTLSEKSMVANVPQVYLFLILVVSLVLWVLLEVIFLTIFVGFALYVVGVVYTKIDPDFSEIIFSKRIKLTCKTKSPDGNRYLS